MSKAKPKGTPATIALNKKASHDYFLEERFEAGTDVTVAVLYERRLAQKPSWPIKVLAEGELTKPLTIHAHKVSKAAREKIEAAGGRIALLAPADAADQPAADAAEA